MSEIEATVKKEEIDPTTNVTGEEKVISKRQLKKQKKAEIIQLKKAERRKQERLKRKAKRAEKVSLNEDLGPSRKKLKSNTMEGSECRVRVAVDCSFDHLMTDRDITKLCQQLQYCYAKNRRAPNPIQLYMTSMAGKTHSRLEEIGFYKSWNVHMKAESFTEVFAREEVVYLSSESSNVLEVLSDDKVYVIGGLVDHNHHKGLCHRLAEERGFEHAQLPIANFMQLSSRNVLAVNHVFEILLKFTETRVWRDAFFSVIPKRKIAAERGDDDNEDGGADNDNDDDDAGGGVDDGDADGINDDDDGGDNDEDGKCKILNDYPDNGGIEGNNHNIYSIGSKEDKDIEKTVESELSSSNGNDLKDGRGDEKYDDDVKRHDDDEGTSESGTRRPNNHNIASKKNA